MSLIIPQESNQVRNSRLIKSLGLAEDVKPINVIAYLFSAFVSVSSLVFLSASTSFALTMVVHLPAHRIGQINGSLVLLDELVALPIVLIWGRLADIYGYRVVTVIGHLAVAISLSIFIQSRFEYQLFLSRISVSIGFAALTTMLTTILTSMTASRFPPRLPEIGDASFSSLDERTSLISRIQTRSRAIGQRSSRLSGLIGFTSGLGALFGVFFLLRLPNYFSSWSSDSSTGQSMEFGVKASFYLTSTLALLTSLLMIFGLCRQGEKIWPIQTRSSTRSTQWKESFQSLTLGFELMKKNRHLIVAYAGGFSARATTIAASAYVPVLVNQYFTSTGQCQLDKPNLPPEEVKKGCHAAFALASALTGTVQLSALLLSPVVGWLASSYSQPMMLAISNIISGSSFIAFGFLPTPDHFLVWPICVLIGLSQITAVVVSLSLCASCRWQIYHSKLFISSSAEQSRTIPEASSLNSTTEPWQDISGAIAGIYSLVGGLGILLGSFGGILSDWSPSAPFFLTGFIAFLASLICWVNSQSIEI